MCALSWGGGGGGSNVTKVMGKVLVINTRDKHYTEDFKFLVYTEAWMSVFLATITTLIRKQQLKIYSMLEGKISVESTEI